MHECREHAGTVALGCDRICRDGYLRKIIAGWSVDEEEGKQGGEGGYVYLSGRDKLSGAVVWRGRFRKPLGEARTTFMAAPATLPPRAFM